MASKTNGPREDVDGRVESILDDERVWEVRDCWEYLLIRYAGLRPLSLTELLSVTAVVEREFSVITVARALRPRPQRTAAAQTREGQTRRRRVLRPKRD